MERFEIALDRAVYTIVGTMWVLAAVVVPLEQIPHWLRLAMIVAGGAAFGIARWGLR